MLKWFSNYHFAQKLCFMTDIMAICDDIFGLQVAF